MPWLELRVRCHHVEFAEEILLSQGAVSLSLVDAGDAPVLEPGPGETPLWPETELVALFPEQHALDKVADALRETLPAGAPLQLHTGRVEDQDWVRLWLDSWTPLKFGNRLWVCPEAKRVEEAGTVCVQLDPGMAFGTGTHESTALCLEWLSAANLEGRRVLDYGCGSGVLGIAALRLGAAMVSAVDLDPQAVTATRSNAAINGVGDRLVACTPEAFATQPYDLVLANILATPLIQLAPRLLDCLLPQGQLVLAGLLDRQAEEVRTAYAHAITFEKDQHKNGWCRIAGRRI